MCHNPTDSIARDPKYFPKYSFSMFLKTKCFFFQNSYQTVTFSYNNPNGSATIITKHRNIWFELRHGK